MCSQIISKQVDIRRPSGWSRNAGNNLIPGTNTDSVCTFDELVFVGCFMLAMSTVRRCKGVYLNNLTRLRTPVRAAICRLPNVVLMLAILFRNSGHQLVYNLHVITTAWWSTVLNILLVLDILFKTIIIKQQPPY